MIKINNVQNSEWGQVVLSDHRYDYDFTYHVPSRTIFNADPIFLIRAKCIALTVGTPLISLSRCIYWLSVSIFRVFCNCYRFLNEPNPSENAFDNISEAFFEGFRALNYSVSLTTSAIKGIVYPYQARMEYGKKERELNRHEDGPHRDKFYLAFCFQPLSKLPQEYPNNCEKAIHKMQKYLGHVDEIRSTLLSFSIRRIYFLVFGL